MAVTNMEFYVVVPKEATNLITNPSFESATTGYTPINEYIANPGFETAGGGGADVFGSWTESAGDGTIARTSTAGEYRGGAYACKLTAGAGLNTVVYQSLALSAGELYTLDLYARGDGVYAGRYDVYDSTNGVSISNGSVGVTGSAFTRFSVTFTVPAGCASTTIFLECPGTATGFACFDDIAVYKTRLSTTTLYQRRGLRSCMVEPASGVAVGMFYEISLTAGTQYSLGVDVLGVSGETYNLYFADLAGTAVSTVTSWTATGFDHRASVTYTAQTTGTHRLTLTRSSVASSAKFYTDCWQLEVGAASTYLDGDQVGLLPSRKDYRWNGTPGASTSWRSGQTRSGGTLLRIKDYARIISILGLGMASVLNVATPVAADYSSYQTTFTQDREFIFNLEFDGLTPGAIQTKRQALIDAVRPDRVLPRQPMVIRYQGLDATGGDASEPIDITALYVDGLGDGPRTPGVEFAAARFVSYLPYMAKAGDSGAIMGFTNDVPNAKAILKRDTNGLWTALGTGGDARVNTIVRSPDGSIYVGGSFSQMGGVADTAAIAKWNGTAWEALGSGLSGAVYAIAVDPAGNLYVGGSFQNAGGVAAADYIAKWDGANWTALGTGANGNVVTLHYATNGILYAGGAFTLMDGVANTVYAAKWNGTAWSAMGSGMDSTVSKIVEGKDGSIYAGGSFTLAGGVANTVKIAKWNGSAWSALSTGMDSLVYDMAVGTDGNLYAGGAFHSAGGITVAHVAVWNGKTWAPLGAGVDDVVYSLAVDTNNVVYAGGVFLHSSGVAFPESLAMYTGGNWIPLDINLPGVPFIYEITWMDNGELWIGFDTIGTGYSANVSVPVLGSATAYPIFRLTGPGTFWQIKNYTTGKAIYFNSLTLLSGETAVLDLRPGRFKFESSFRGNLSNIILSGSDFDFPLLIGANAISAYIYGSTSSATQIYMTWEQVYWSLDAANVATAPVTLSMLDFRYALNARNLAIGVI